MTLKTATSSLLTALLLSACAFPGASALAQAPIDGAVPLSTPSSDLGQYLANVYKDEPSGFRLAPPVGSRIIRKQGKDLMAFVVDAKSWGGNLQLITMDRKGTLEEYVLTVKADLSRTFKGVQIRDSSLLKLGGRDACRLTTSMEAVIETAPPDAKNKGARPAAKAETLTLLRQQLIVQMAGNQFMVLSMWSPLRDLADATATFSAMLDTFEVFNPGELKERRVKAMAAGKKWLASLSAEDLARKLNNQPQIFRMIIDGKDLGYMRFDEKITTLDDALRTAGASDPRTSAGASGGRKGIEVDVNFRSFPEDGSIIYGKNVAFWGNSREAGDAGEALPHYSMWNNIAKVSASVPGKAERATAWRTETGSLNQEGTLRFSDEDLKRLAEERAEQIRKNPQAAPPPAIPQSVRQYRIKITLDGDENNQKFRIPTIGNSGRNTLDLPIPKDAPSDPLPKLLEYTWTRLVDLTKPTEMSFAVFDSEAQNLAVRTLIVTGKKERISLAGKSLDCYKCIVELDPGSTTLWVDDQGKVVTMRTSDQTVLSPTTEQEMTARWASRLGQQ